MQTDRARRTRQVWTRSAFLAGGMAAIALIVALIVVTVQDSAAAPQMGSKRVYFRIATGVVSGTYFPIGEAIARLESRPDGSRACDPGARCGVAGVTAVATASEGSVANVQLVSTGHVESGLAQADVALWAYEGKGPFERTGALTGLRAIASLHPEAIHLVVAANSKIKSVKDLRGKRVGIDSYLGGANHDARLILRAYKLGPETVKLLEIGSEVAAVRLAAGEIDAFFFIGGWPVPMVSDLAARGLVALVPINGPQIATVLHDNPLLMPMIVPANTYGGLPAVETVGVNALWVTLASVPDDLIYALTAALWNAGNRATLKGAHPSATTIQPEDAVWGVPIPLHAGAERYYREKGLSGGTSGIPIRATPPIPRKPPANVSSPQANR